MSSSLSSWSASSWWATPSPPERSFYYVGEFKVDTRRRDLLRRVCSCCGGLHLRAVSLVLVSMMNSMSVGRRGSPELECVI